MAIAPGVGHRRHIPKLRKELYQDRAFIVTGRTPRQCLAAKKRTLYLLNGM